VSLGHGLCLLPSFLPDPDGLRRFLSAGRGLLGSHFLWVPGPERRLRLRAALIAGAVIGVTS